MAKPVQRSGNLPAEATSFIGRRRELGELKRRLSDARLVSLVGPGGVGKTRLALRAARDLGRRFRDGAWLVELADVHDTGLVSNAVMTALDLRAQASTEPLPLLLSFLGDKQLLLIVDNCEHLLEAVAPLLAEVLKRAPEIRVLTTSREPVLVDGEHILSVPPLELPSDGADEGLDQLRRNEAVMLFCERAAAAAGSFDLTADNRRPLIELCRRLDGLPLAIELAAARTRSLDLDQIVERLTDRFGLLTKGSRAALPRHQTLRTTIDWSYELLPEEEKQLLRRLCVFAGRFTAEDAEGVCDGSLELLSSLVDRSLVIREHGPGYRLLETMRDYARLRLSEAGEELRLEERCAEHYARRCERAAVDARYRLVEWLGWIDLEIDNIRWVLRQCLNRRDFARGIRLVTSLRYFWITRATVEGVRWLDELLGSGGAEPATMARAYYLRGLLAQGQGDSEAAATALDRSVAAARASGDPEVLSPSLSLRSVSAQMTGDAAAARRWLDEARTTTDAIDDYLATITYLQARSLNALFEADPGEMQVASAEGVRLSGEKGDLYSLEMMLMNSGGAALTAGDSLAARPRYEEGLRVARRIDDRVAQLYFVEALAMIAASSGQARRAAQLIGAAATIRAAVGAKMLDLVARRLGRAREIATTALGERRFAAELEAGGRLGRPDAIALALGEPARPDGAGSGDPVAGPLGKRQAEVAKLIAEGLSNRQIGARLFISERTVDAHVRGILDKLGFDSRTQIAAWMASSA